METSIFVARLLAVVDVVVGIGILMNPAYYHKMMTDLMKNTTFLFFGGTTNLVIGTLLVTYHNIWELSWVVLITITGYMALLKGVSLLVFPGHVNMWQPLIKESALSKVAIFSIVLGLIFGYFGFVA